MEDSIAMPGPKTTVVAIKVNVPSINELTSVISTLIRGSDNFSALRKAALLRDTRPAHHPNITADPVFAGLPSRKNGASLI